MDGDRSPHSRRDRRRRSRPKRYGRTSFALAGLLTVAMFSWQGFHLADAFYGSAVGENGHCVTRSAQDVRLAGERQLSMVDALTHEMLVFGHPVSVPAAADWRSHLDQVSTEMGEAILVARTDAKPLTGPIESVETAAQRMDLATRQVLDLLGAGATDGAVESVESERFGSARLDLAESLTTLETSVDQWTEIRQANERRTELVSVSVAVAMFVAAVAAWLLFARRYQLGRRLLAEEEARRRDVEAELLQAQKMEMVGLMAGGIAHDFANLATAMRGSVTDARHTLPSDHPAGAHLDRIDQAAARADDVVRPLLSFARPTETAPAPVSMGSLIDELAPLLRAMLGSRIALELDTDPKATVLGDPARLRQMVVNLAVNARDAMPEGGRLTLVGRRHPGDRGVEVEVSDTGIGMTDEVRAHIFEPFFTTRAAAGGTGLGLPIVAGIVADHGGRIRVRSTPGVGTRFVVELPAPASSPNPSDAGIVRVLVLSNRYQGALAAAALESDGYVVRLAALEAATEAIERNEVLVVDADDATPELLARLAGRSAPSVAFTTGDQPDAGLPIPTLHAPFSFADLRAMVAAARSDRRVGV